MPRSSSQVRTPPFQGGDHGIEAHPGYQTLSPARRQSSPAAFPLTFPPLQRPVYRMNQLAPDGSLSPTEQTTTAGRAGADPAAALPAWARGPRQRRFFTRKRLSSGGVILLLLGFLLWLNYPFLPDFRVLLFNRPTSQLSSQSTPGQWAMHGGDLAQTKALPRDAAGTPPAGRLLWSTPLGENTRSAPIVADGRVYVGGHFQIAALDAATGDLLWRQPATGPVPGTLAAAGPYLYVGLQDHHLRALDPATGESRWQFRAGDAITAAPVVHQGILYFGSWDSRLYALDAATGAEIWTYQATARIASPAAISDNILAVGDRNGRMHLLNARTGQNRLIFRTPKSTYAAAVMAHDLVYFAAGGRLYAINAAEKEIPGQYQFKRVWAQLWLWKTPGVPPPAKQQAGRWRFSPEGEDSTIVAAPAVAAGRLYVGDLQGILYTLDALTGKELARVQLQGGLYAPPLLAGGTLYAATQEGYLYALDAATGQTHWRLNLGAPVEQPMALAGGRLYIRTADGIIHAVE